MGVHTWFTANESQIYNYDVDVRVTEFETPEDPNWLYFFALQVNFRQGGEWAHGGLQHTGLFREHNSLGVNWGGQSNASPDGDGIGHNVVPFQWVTNRWYRYRVWQVAPPSGAPDRFGWVFAILDYDTNQEQQFGCVETISEYIDYASVFTEDGYGSQFCHCPTTRLEWRNPRYRVPGVQRTPSGARTSYNGIECPADKGEDQAMIVNTQQEKRWYHALRVPNTVPGGATLWGN